MFAKLINSTRTSFCFIINSAEISKQKSLKANIYKQKKSKGKMKKKRKKMENIYLKIIRTETKRFSLP